MLKELGGSVGGKLGRERVLEVYLLFDVRA